jgi:hypothetical protein
MSSSGLCRGRGACGVRCAGRRDRCPAIARFPCTSYPGAAMPSSGRLPNPPFAAREPLRAEFSGSAGWRKRPLPCHLYVPPTQRSVARAEEGRDINQTPTKSTILFLVQYLPNHAEVFLYRRNTGPRTAAHPLLSDAAPKRLGPRLRPFGPQDASKITLLCDHQICTLGACHLNHPLLHCRFFDDPMCDSRLSSIQLREGRDRQTGRPRMSD